MTGPAHTAWTGPARAHLQQQSRPHASLLPAHTGYVPYAGDGFALLLPSKWNPSPQKEFPGTVLRWVVADWGLGLGCPPPSPSCLWLLAQPSSLPCASFALQLRGQLRCREQPGSHCAERGQGQR